MRTFFWKTCYCDNNYPNVVYKKKQNIINKYFLYPIHIFELDDTKCSNFQLYIYTRHISHESKNNN